MAAGNNIGAITANSANKPGSQNIPWGGSSRRGGWDYCRGSWFSV